MEPSASPQHRSCWSMEERHYCWCTTISESLASVHLVFVTGGLVSYCEYTDVRTLQGPRVNETDVTWRCQAGEGAATHLPMGTVRWRHLYNTSKIGAKHELWVVSSFFKKYSRLSDKSVHFPAQSSSSKSCLYSNCSFFFCLFTCTVHRLAVQSRTALPACKRKKPTEVSVTESEYRTLCYPERSKKFMILLSVLRNLQAVAAASPRITIQSQRSTFRSTRFNSGFAQTRGTKVTLFIQSRVHSLLCACKMKRDWRLTEARIIVSSCCSMLYVANVVNVNFFFSYL